jgi:hypothetical protein
MSASAKRTTVEPDTRRAESAGNTPAVQMVGEAGATGFDAMLGSAPAEPPVARTAHLLGHPVLARPANRPLLAGITRRAQLSYGNHFAQRAVAEARTTPAATPRIHRACEGCNWGVYPHRPRVAKSPSR